MIPDKVQRNIETEGLLTTQKNGIAEGCEYLVLTAIRKDIYSDPQKSIWREYCANALDEHLRLDKGHEPFEVTFPNYLSPSFKVRDFGRGLTEEQVFYFFGKLGASDKRDSNKMIGAFGFGCKVGHAYTDNFTITSYKDGVKRVFCNYIGEDELGDISKLSETPTKEPNGVEIAVPVLPKDISDFQQKGLEVLKYFPTKPTIKGLPTAPEFDNSKPLVEGNGWKFFGSGRSVCLMGAIGYEIDVNAMGNLESWERELLNSGLHLQVTIGEVNVTASRENLRMTDKTIRTIKDKLKAIQADMVITTQKRFAECKNLIEAKCLFNDIITFGSGYGNIVRASGVKLIYNGQEINTEVIEFSDAQEIVTYTKQKWRKRIDLLVQPQLRCGGSDFELYYDDTDKKKIRYKRRAVTLINAGAKRVIIVRSSDPKEFEQVTGVPVSSLKSLQAVQETLTTVSRNVSFGPRANKSKHQTRVFQLNRSALSTNVSTTMSDFWDIKTVELKKGLYIPIDRFQPVLPNFKTLREVRHILTVLESYGVTLRLPVYGLKQGVDSGQLVRFDTWLEKRIRRIKNLQRHLNFDAMSSMDFISLQTHKQHLTGVLLKYKLLRDELWDVTHNYAGQSKRKTLAKHGNMTGQRNDELKNLEKEVIDKYPLIQYIDTGNHNKPEVINYLKEKK